MPTETIIEFIIYITPGFLAMQIYRAVYPIKGRGDFAEITWSVIYGICVYAIVRWLDINIFGLILKSNTTGFPSLRFIGALLACGVIFGFGRTLIHYLRLLIGRTSSRLSFLTPDPQSIWAKIARTNQWAVIFLDDGTIYIGWISNYTFNPENTDQDFLVSEAKRVDENLKELYIIDGIGVYLNTRDVKRIEFLKSPQKSLP